MTQTKPTLVIGASENPDRYSNMAIRALRKHGIPTRAHGNREGQVLDVKIEKKLPSVECDTITLYLSAKNQESIIQPVLDMKPRRVIFNPGTENEEFEQLLERRGIEVIRACTLVMLNTGQY
jgi:predicted CoA-binding protein